MVQGCSAKVNVIVSLNAARKGDPPVHNGELLDEFDETRLGG
jgi:hypothetical protein